jgi:phage shock protein C
MKKLYRTKNRSILGVCGGLGAYYNIDPTVLRLLTVVVVLFTGVFPGVIAYVLAALIIPEEPN